MKKTLLLLLFTAMFFSASAQADTVYTYTGNAYNSCSGAYTCNGTTPALSITFDTTLTGSQLDNLTLNGTGVITADVTVFSMSDGVGGTFNTMGTFGPAVDIATDSTGAIVEWEINGTTAGTCNFAISRSDTGGSLDRSYYETTPCNGEGITAYGEIDNLPGTWTVTDPVGTPEPSSLLLLSSGLVGLGFMKRKVFHS